MLQKYVLAYLSTKLNGD